MVEQNVEIKKEIEDKELDNFQIDTFKLESDIPYDENNEPIEDIKVSPELFDNDEDYIPEDQGNLLRGIDNYQLIYGASSIKGPLQPQYDGVKTTMKKGTPKILSKSISRMPMGSLVKH